jgi:uncharacterized protein (TIGR00297 family)
MLTPVLATAEFFTVIAFALAAVLLKTIDGRGFLACVAVGLSIIYGGGVSWFIMVAVFFALGVVFTLYEYGYKRELGSAQEKGGARNWPNILANGGFASVIALLNLVGPSLFLSILFLGALSASAADTVATELGLLSHSKPKLITNPAKTVTPGTSGGVTFLGALGAVFASLVIGSMAFLLEVGPKQLYVVFVCVIGGVVGATLDSVLGATAQRRGYCAICLKPTETLRHCGESTRMTGGTRFIENNVVNLLATIAGAAAALAVLLILTPIT